MQHSDKLWQTDISNGSSDSYLAGVRRLKFGQRIEDESKGWKTSQVFEVIYKGKTTTWMKNPAIGIIKELNPLRLELPWLPTQYEQSLLRTGEFPARVSYCSQVYSHCIPKVS